MNFEELNLVELSVQETKEVEGGLVFLLIFALGFYVGYKNTAAANNP